MTATQARLPAISSELEPRRGLVDRLSRAAARSTAAFPPEVVRVQCALPRRPVPPRDTAWRRARAAEALHLEDDRMRLLAALLFLATLLLWVLFLQG
jgi:hypothetical protein